MEEGEAEGNEQVRAANFPGGGAAPATAWNWPHAVARCTPKKIAKKVVLVAVIVMVWMVLAIPTVIFYLPQVCVQPFLPNCAM